MARNSHIIFDGYSYEPPSYEEAQASASANQSVYKSTVSQSQDTNYFAGFRPLYLSNGYNGLTEYNLAKRRRRMRIAVATALSIFCIIIMLAILFWKINSGYQVSHTYKSYADLISDEDLTPYQSYKDSSLYNYNNNYYREPVNDNKPIQYVDDNVTDKPKVKGNVENHNDPFTNNGDYYGGYDWEKEGHKKVLEKLQSKDFGIHSPNTRDEKESSIDYDKFISGLNEYLAKEMEKLDLKQFKSANTGKEKESFGNENSGGPFDLNQIMQIKLEKLKSGNNNVGGNNLWNSYLEEEIEKLNLNPIVSSSGNPISKPDKNDKNILIGKSRDDDDIKIPDSLISHTGDADINEVHESLKSLKDEIAMTMIKQ